MRGYAVGFLAVLAAGCASASSDPCAPERPIEHVTLRYPGGFEQLAVAGDRFFGPTMEVARYDGDYRGISFRRNVDLRVGDDKIEGVIGNDRTELHIEKYDDGFALRGLYGGQISHLRVRADRLEGWLGGRTFLLERSASDPLVYRSPTGRGPIIASAPPTITGRHLALGLTELTLPPSFESLTTERKAMVLALFLGR
jgi:hypothetical protein